MLATKFLTRKAELKRTKRNLHLRHIRQLRADIPHSRTSSAVYLDLLDAMNDVLAHTFNIAYTLQEHSHQPFPSSFRGFRTGQFAKVNSNTQRLPEEGNGTNTQHLYEVMNGTGTRPLYPYVNETNTQHLHTALNGTNTQHLYPSSPTDAAQMSEW